MIQFSESKCQIEAQNILNTMVSKLFLYSSYFLLHIAALKKRVLFLSRDLLTIGEQLQIQMIADIVAEKRSILISHGSLLCD